LKFNLLAVGIPNITHESLTKGNNAMDYSCSLVVSHSKANRQCIDNYINNTAIDRETLFTKG